MDSQSDEHVKSHPDINSVLHKIRTRIERKDLHQMELLRMNQLNDEIAQKTRELEEIKRKSINNPKVSMNEECDVRENKPLARSNIITVSDDDDDVTDDQSSAKIKLLEKQMDDMRNSSNQQLIQMGSQLKQVMALLSNTSSSPASQQTSLPSSVDIEEMSDEQIIVAHLKLQAELLKRKQNRKTISSTTTPSPPLAVSAFPSNLELTASSSSTQDQESTSSQGTSPTMNSILQSSAGSSIPPFKRKLDDYRNGIGSIVKKAAISALKNNDEPIVNESETSEFNCKQCGKKWSNGALLQMHESLCNAPRSDGEHTFFECSLCRRNMLSIDKLLIHRLETHGVKVMLNCGICKKDFLSKAMITRHLNVEYNMYPCKSCGSSLESKDDLEEHESLCIEEDDIDIPIEMDDNASPFLPSPASCDNRIDKESPLNLLLKIEQSYSGREIDLNGMFSRAQKRKVCAEVEFDECDNSNSALFSKLVKKDEEQPVIQCWKCHMIVSTIPQLLNHRKEMHGEANMLVCGRCGEMFDTREEVERHLNIEYRIFGCIKCGHRSKDKETMEQHERLCDPKKEITCNLCMDGLIFPSVTDLISHRHRHHGPASALQCGFCGKKFETRVGIHQHLTVVELGLFKCSTCERLFLTQQKLEDHEKKDCSGRPKPRRTVEVGLKCKHCAHSTMMPEILEEHESKCSGRVEVPIDCSICLQRFNSIKVLLNHRKDVHGEEKMMECGICGKIYSRRDAIANHLNTEYRVYVCLRCDRPYQLLGQVYEHEKSCMSRQTNITFKDVTPSKDHNSSTASISSCVKNGEDSIIVPSSGLSCSRCGCRTSSAHILADHELNCEGEKFSPIIECDLCNEQYTSINEILQHRTRVHGPEMMLKCVKCPKSFETRKGIVGHLNLELQLLPCLGCKRPFSSFSNLSVHERTCEKAFGAPQNNSTNTVSAGRTTAAQLLIYQCSKCGHKSGSSNIVEEHEKGCKGDNNLVEISCSLCFEPFPTVSDLQSHRTKVHGEEAASRCGICEKTFESKHGIHAHLTVEYGVMPCLKCGKPQGGAPQLLEHEKSCTRNDSVGMNCVKCNKISYSKEIMSEHELKCEGPKEKDIQCVLCYESFMNIQSLLNHSQRDHSEEAMLTCGMCGRRFESKNGIWGHLNVEYEVYPCLQCGKPQHSSGRLLDHEKTCSGTTGTNDTDFKSVTQCAKCLKIAFVTTFTKSAFLQHEESCTGAVNDDIIKDISCMICNESYFTSSDLVSHRYRVHGEESALECPLCGRRFESKSGIVNHLNVEFSLFPCSKCAKPQASNARRNDHEKNCQEDGADFSQCSICLKYGQKKDDVAKHEEKCNGNDETVGDNKKSINCASCDATFINIGSLLSHSNKQHGENAMLTCPVCSRKFESKHGIMMHLLLEYSEFSCSKCGKSQINANKLNDHEQNCWFMKALSCEECEMITFNEQALESHKASCGRAEESKIACTECNIKFMSVPDFLTHRSQSHGGEAAMLKCVICNKRLSSKSGMVWHYNMEFLIYPCSKCGKACRSEQQMCEHESKCNGTDTSESNKDANVLRKCEKCERQSFSVPAFTKHVERCNGELPSVDEKIISCDVCKEKFLLLSDLLSHRHRTHGEYVMLQCNFCDRNFGSKNGLYGHLQCEYGTYQCSKCGLHVYSPSRWEEHERLCNIVLENELMECETCGIRSFTCDSITQHQSICNGEGTCYECKTCSIPLLSVFDLLHHKLRAHGERTMLECQECGKKFASMTGIYWHLNKKYEVYKCRSCEKPQYSANLLTDHEKHCKRKAEKGEVSGGNEKNVMESYIMNCNNCGIATYYKNMMTLHEEECDGSPTLTAGGKEIYCNICDEKYLTINDLLTHRQKNHGEEAMLKCGVCQRKYESKNGVHQHLNIEFCLYPCRICGISSSGKSNKVKHEKTCTNEVKEKREEALTTMLRCLKCNRGTFMQSIMETHELTCQGDPNPDEETVISCSLCIADTLTVNDLLLHRQRDHGEAAMLACGLCNKVYESKSGIQQHLNLEYKIYTCTVCSKYFTGSRLLRKHSKICSRPTAANVSTNAPLEMVECEKCSISSYSRQSMNDHEESCDGGRIISNELKCSICELVCLLASDLITHRKDEHGNSAMLTCGKCNEKFENRDRIYRHTVMEYEVYKCDKCEKVVRCRSNLVDHRQRCMVGKSTPDLEDEIRELQCDKCNKKSFSDEIMVKHETKCQGPTEDFDDIKKTITCSECSDKFILVSDLINHYEIKHGDGWQQCQFCEKRMESKQGIIAHLNIEYKIYKCSKCSRPMASKKRREIHETSCVKTSFNVLKSNDSVLQMNEEGSYDCSKCERKAFNVNVLRKHKLECIGDQNLTQMNCSLCDARYLTVADLLTHRQKIHGNEAMLKCGICGKRSSQRSLIHSHLTMEYRLFECSTCERCFESSTKLAEHATRCRRSHEDSESKMEAMDYKPAIDVSMKEEEEYVCSNCNRISYNLLIYNEHIKYCNGDASDINCWQCDSAQFISVGDLLKHRSQVHGVAEMLKCGFCGRKANCKNSMRGHLSVEFRLYQCPKCDRCFDCSRRLDLHTPKCS